MLDRWQTTIVDEKGNVRPGAVVQVRSETTGALAAVYKDPEGTQPWPTGFVTADENGYVHFHAHPDYYRITSINPAIDWRYVKIGVDTEQIAEAAAEAIEAATEQADRAEQEADRADSAADRAKQEADRAEDAAATAAVVAGIYADTAEGLAGTSDGDVFAVVSPDDDSVADLYKNDSGIATPLGKSVPSTEFVRSIPARTEPSVNLISAVVDARGSIVAGVDVDGEHHTPGLDGRTIEQAVRDTERKFFHGTGFRTRTLLEFRDKDDNIVTYQNENGALYIPGMAGSVQHATQQPLSRVPYFRDAWDDYHPIVKDYVLALLADGRPFVPPPALLVPNNYNVPDEIVSEFTVTKTTDLWIDTPYGPGGLVHPYILEMRRPFLGYRYIMVDTPHRNTSQMEENPVLYGTNDLLDFDMIPDVQQPMDWDPKSEFGWDGINSDPCFTYDLKTGAFVLITRKAGSPDGNGYSYRLTWNGIDWTPPQFSAPGTTGTLSQSILFNPFENNWHLWCVYNGALIHASGPSMYGPWTMISMNSFPSLPWKLWHLEVKWMGTKFLAFAVDDPAIPDGPGNLYLGISSDGDTWTWGPGVIQSESDPWPYKPTFLPEFRGNEMRLRMIWNTYRFPLPSGLVPTLHSEATNWVDLSTL